VHLSPAAARRTGGVLWQAPIRAAAPPRTAALPAGTPAVDLGMSAVEAIPRIEVPPGLSAQLSQPPRFLIPIYRHAGHRYRVPWRVLAAINAIETDYGRDLSVSSQGATGWMQFMPGTWGEYGGGGNPYDPRDAIFAAARLLHAAGASHDLRQAIFAYNHAGWYVAAVLWRASTISARARAALDRQGYALPLDARYMRTLGRTDDGVDIETAPEGAAVYSITPGVVTAVASDPAGFGPDYPVILATGGPLAGQYVYYGHVAVSLVGVGQRVLAGQPVAIMGHTGDAASLGHGHIEIGFCDSGGDPLNHHGAGAWTPSGQAMRSILVSLSAKLGIASS
jgi:murein DD-endopeptidase MepM/ murein hydrolase activator NlpD